MKKRRVQSFSKIGGAFEVPPGGGVKIQILPKKGQFSKLVYVMKTKIFLTWLEAKLLTRSTKHHSKTYFVLV